MPVGHRVLSSHVLTRLDFDDRGGELPVCAVNDEQIRP